jgi:hypothetical protein
MTWPEVASDAIKIGVPSLLTYFITRSSRRYEEEKENRKEVKQELELLAQSLTLFHASFERRWDICRTSILQGRVVDSEEIEELRQIVEKLDNQKVEIEKSCTVLSLRGVEVSTPTLLDYFRTVQRTNRAYQQTPPLEKVQGLKAIDQLNTMESEALTAFQSLIESFGRIARAKKQ